MSHFKHTLIGKLNKDYEFDTVLQHCINAAWMAYVRYQSLDLRRQAVLASLIGVSTKSCAQLIAIIAGSHDIAKMDLAFLTQRGINDGYNQQNEEPINDEIISDISAFKEPVGGMRLNPLHHGPMASVILPRLFKDEFNINRSMADMMTHCVTAHHGLYPSRQRVENLRAYFAEEKIHEPYPEMAMQRADLLQQLRNQIDPDRSMEIPASIPLQWSLLVGGLVINADHNASRENNFPLQNGAEKPDGQAQAEAEAAIQRYGIGITTPTKAFTFKGFGIIPRPHQEKIESYGQLEGLTVLKMPTGAGKSISSFLAALQHKSGFTMLANRRSTANGMHSAAIDFLKKNPDAATALPALAHSDAGCVIDSAMESVIADPEMYRHLENFREIWQAALALQGESLQDCLSAQYTVATVDQALMSVIADGKFVGRGYWLFSRPIIIDEIHSYDGRMDAILERFLYYSGFFGTPVIALTATVATMKLQKFLDAYAEGAQTKASKQVELTDQSQLIHLDPSGQLEEFDLPCDVNDAKRLDIQWFEHGGWAKTISQLSTQHNRIAVVCGTTTHVRELTQQIREPLEKQGFHVMSYHSRHRPGDRRAKEETLFAYCGKDPSKQGKIIVVATQVLRESLDVSFDVVVTHVQPAEDLVQIAGRVGRFDRTSKVKTYQMWLEEPTIDKDSGQLSIGPASYVLLPKTTAGYRGATVLRTYAYLKMHPIVKLPAMAQSFVDNAYDIPDQGKSPSPEGLPQIYQQFWDPSVAKQQRAPSAERAEADRFVVPKLPDPNATDVAIWDLAGMTRFKEMYISHSPRDITHSLQIFVGPKGYKQDPQYSKSFIQYVKAHCVSVSNRPHLWHEAQAYVMNPGHPILGNVVLMHEEDIKQIGPYQLRYDENGLGILYTR